MKKLLFIIFIFFSTLAIANEQASRVDTSTTNFNNNLSSSDNTVQKALDTLDNVSIGAGAGDITTVGDCLTGDCFAVNGSGAENNIYFEGATSNTAELDLRGGDPVGDVVVTIPALTGTLLSDTTLQDSGRLAAVIGDESGTDKVAFTNSPVFTTPNIGSATGSITGNAGTATALAANGANCSAGNYPLGVDASGAVESCTADDDVPDAADFTNLALTGDVSSVGLTTTIEPNSVALTTDTTGNYAAGDAEAGSALTGDSATSFFSSGVIELARGGTNESLSDPNDDQILFWDDSYGGIRFLDLGSHLSISSTTISVSTGTSGAVIPLLSTANSWGQLQSFSGATGMRVASYLFTANQVDTTSQLVINETSADTASILFSATSGDFSLKLKDNNEFYFGNGSDATIVYDGTNFLFNPDLVGTGYMGVTGDFRLTDGTNSIIYDESEHSFTYNIKSGSINNFKITGTESTAPASNPNYFYIDLDRTWSGTGIPANMMNVVVDDSRDLNNSGTDLVTIFNFDYNRTGERGSIAALTGFNIDLSEAAIGGDTSVDTIALKTSTISSPSTGTSQNITSNYTSLQLTGGTDADTNTAQTATINNIGTDYNPSLALMAGSIGIGADVSNVYGYRFRPSQTGLSATETITSYGILHDPTYSGATVTSYFAWVEDGDDLVLDDDGGAIVFGEGQDADIMHDGTDWEFNPILATTAIVFNEDSLDTDFRIESNDLSDLFFVDAGENDLEINGHIESTGTVPALSSCGTGPSISATATDQAGKITVGSGALVTSCTLTFDSAWNNAPPCTVINGTQLAVFATTSTTALTITSATSMDEDVLMYMCLGNE